MTKNITVLFLNSIIINIIIYLFVLIVFVYEYMNTPQNVVKYIQNILFTHFNEYPKQCTVENGPETTEAENWSPLRGIWCIFFF